MYTLEKKKIEQFFKAANDLFASITVARNSVSFDYKQLLLRYEELLYACVNHPPVIFHENYVQEITILGVTFDLLWDVEKLKLLSHHIEAKEIPTKEAFMCVDASNILERKLFQNNPQPALIAEIPFAQNGYAAVDGNHRIASAYYRNNPFVLCKFLPYYVHVEALSPTSKILFKVFCNIAFYVSYCQGNITMEDLQDSLLKI